MRDEPGKRTGLLATATVALLMMSGIAGQAARPLPTADEWVPDRAVLVLNVVQPKALLDVLLNPKLTAAVEASPAYKAAAAKPGFIGLKRGVRHLEERFGANWQTLLRRLTGGGVTWAIGHGKERLLIFDATDSEILGGLHQFALEVAKNEARKKGLPDPTSSAEHGDATIWALGPKAAYAIVGKRLVMANRVDVLKAALDLRDNSRGKSIATTTGYRRAMRAAGADAVASLYADAGVVKSLPKIAKALSAERNPMATLLVAPLTEAFARSSWLALSARIRDRALTIGADWDGTIGARGAARFARRGATMPTLAVPRRIAAMSLYRDLQGFYAAKDALFPERTSGLIFFENMMGIYFTGRDLTDEVLTELGPYVRLVVAEQAYDREIGTPAVQFPAFALVLPMENPDEFPLIAEEAWQKAIGMVNFTRGQKAEPGLIIDREFHKEVKYSVAAFRPPKKKGRKDIDVRFNFRPTLASASKHIILSSTDALAEDIMDALAKEKAQSVKPSGAAHSVTEIDGKQLASILTANRDNLIHRNMVEKGNTQAQAESELDTLMDIVRHVAGVRVSFGDTDGGSKAAARIQFAKSPTPGEK